MRSCCWGIVLFHLPSRHGSVFNSNSTFPRHIFAVCGYLDVLNWNIFFIRMIWKHWYGCFAANVEKSELWKFFLPWKLYHGRNSRLLLIETFHLIVLFCNFVAENNRGFPKIGHSGSSARIVLKQNKFSKKVTYYRVWLCDPRAVVLTSCVYSLVPFQLC